MELASDILDAMIGSAPSPADKREDGKRPSRRFPFGSRASVVAIHDGAELPEHTVLLRESSPTDFTFIDDESRNIGEPLSVLFTGVKKGRVKIRCVVTRSEATTEFGTEFIIGASFEQVLEPAAASPVPAVQEDIPSVEPVEKPQSQPEAPHETKVIATGEKTTMQGNPTPQNPSPERAAAASHNAAAGSGKNQQILSKVLARLAEQEQALKRLEEERNDAVRDCELLRQELTTVSQSLKILQAKCDADDAAIAELAKLMETDTAADRSPAQGKAA